MNEENKGIAFVFVVIALSIGFTIAVLFTGFITYDVVLWRVVGVYHNTNGSIMCDKKNGCSQDTNGCVSCK